VYVGDRCNQRVLYYAAGQTSSTVIAGSTGVSGNTSILLNLPSAVVTDSQFNIYVADNTNNRIQRYLHY
jgi:Flp pilus assembly CpaF family ATPase